MSVVIHKNDSEKTIHEAIQKVLKSKEKKVIDLDKYFGKVSFNMGGLAYQKKIRDEWE